MMNLSGILSECHTVLIPIMPDIFSGLIWVQAAFKGYQQITKVATSRKRFKNSSCLCKIELFLMKAKCVLLFVKFSADDVLKKLSQKTRKLTVDHL